MRAGVAVLLALLATSGIANGAARRVAHLVESVVLPNYGGDWYTVATSINNRGDIAGYASRGEDEAVAWIRTARRGYQAIADRGFAFDINNRGEVVGVRVLCVDEECRSEGFFWSRAEGLQNLGSFLPFAVNDRGDMAGACEAAEWHACVTRGAVVSVVAGPGSVANGINRRGDVVGTYGDNRAFHLTPAWQFKDIGRAVATGINDRRVIAGHRWTDMGERGERAVVTAWSRGKPRSPLREVSVGDAINDKGWVIANAWDENEESYSFVWNSTTKTRVILDSAKGEWVLLEDINDRGDVVGTAGLRSVIWRVRQRHLTPSR